MSRRKDISGIYKITSPSGKIYIDLKLVERQEYL